MGIYTNGAVFGIKIYNIKDDDINILLEIKNDIIMTDEEKKKVNLFYKQLDNKENILFKIYTECSSTYAKGVFMSWYPISKYFFFEKFDRC